MINFIRKFWKSLSLLLILLYLSFAPPSNFKEVPPIKIEYFDKFVHVVLYVIFTVILIVDFRKFLDVKTYKSIFFICCFIFPVLLGGFIEIAQETWFSPRTAELIDWFADIIGIGIGFWIATFIKGKNVVV
jgi:VanZ family protein